MNLEREPADDKGINWMPEWIVEIGPLGMGKVGIAKDDGCYVVLVRMEGGKWSPTKWIPKEAAIFIANLEGR